MQKAERQVTLPKLESLKCLAKAWRRARAQTITKYGLRYVEYLAAMLPQGAI